MKHRPLGRTGLYVSEICLGTMTFGGQGAWWKAVGQVDQSNANALVERALAAGVNFIDHLRGALEMILQQIGGGDRVALDRCFINQPVFGPDVARNVRDGN